MISTFSLEEYGIDRVLLVTFENPFQQQSLTIHPEGLLVYTNDKKDKLSDNIRTERRYIPLLSIQGIRVDTLSLRIWAMSVTEGYCLEVFLCEKNKDDTYQLLNEQEQDKLQRFLDALYNDIEAHYKTQA